MSAPKQVTIIEDDVFTREELERKVGGLPGFSVLAAVGSVTEARAALSQATPDILLCDLQLPDGDGTEIIREQSLAHPDLPILVISILGEETRVVGAIAAGAQGYLLKDESSDEISQALDQLLQGGSPISPLIARHLIRRFQPAEPTAQGVTLTARELEVLKLAAKGFTYKETAELLNISVNTVGTLTKRIYSKMTVNSRSEAVFEATRLGLMDDRR